MAAYGVIENLRFGNIGVRLKQVKSSLSLSIYEQRTIQPRIEGSFGSKIVQEILYFLEGVK